MITFLGVCGSFPTRQEEPEESAAEKIYASLRECREMNDPKRAKGVKMQGFLQKKKEKTDRWKSQYFVLKQENQDCHLYIYDHPKRTKPKGLIDLSCAYLYSAHESLFDKRNVFQLVERALPCLATMPSRAIAPPPLHHAKGAARAGRAL